MLFLHSLRDNQRKVYCNIHKFLTWRQRITKTIHNFCTNLILLRLAYELGIIRQRLISDVLICGINNKFQHVKEHLLRKTLENTVNMYKAAEFSQQQLEELEEYSNQEICAVKRDSTSG